MTSKSTVGSLRKSIKKCFQELQSESHVAVLHCAAGVHRTGTIGYTLLRLAGTSAQDAFEGLKTMREETYNGVGEWRIKLAEDELVPYLYKELYASSDDALNGKLKADADEENKEEE